MLFKHFLRTSFSPLQFRGSMYGSMPNCNQPQPGGGSACSSRRSSRGSVVSANYVLVRPGNCAAFPRAANSN